jgi:hypothetical protein
VEQYGPLPPGVFGGDIFIDLDGRGLVVNGIDGRVVIIFGDDSRAFTPKQARRVAVQLVDAADLMDVYPQEHSDGETARLAGRRQRKRDREIQ